MMFSSNTDSQIIHILIIEDEPAIVRSYLRMLPRILRDECHIHHVDNANSAIEYLKHNTVSFIISDFNIVGSTGEEVLAMISQEMPQMLDFFLFNTSVDVSAMHHRSIMKPAGYSTIKQAIQNMGFVLRAA